MRFHNVRHRTYKLQHTTYTLDANCGLYYCSLIYAAVSHMNKMLFARRVGHMSITYEGQGAVKSVSTYLLIPFVSSRSFPIGRRVRKSVELLRAVHTLLNMDVTKVTQLWIYRLIREIIYATFSLLYSLSTAFLPFILWFLEILRTNFR